MILPQSILTLTALRSIVGSMNFDYLNTNRKDINNKLRESLSDFGNEYGIEFLHAEIGRIKPIDNTLLGALTKQIIAERNKRSIIIESEGIKEVEIKKADGFKKSYEILAQGMAKATINLAEGKAKQVEIVSSEALKHIHGYALSLWELDLWKKMCSSKDTNVVLPLNVKGLVSCMKGIEGKK